MNVKLKKIIFFIALLTPAVVFGQFVTNHYVTYNHFRCTDNICAPAKVKSNTLGTFYVYYDDTVVEGDLGYWEACDCNGNRIVTGMPYTHTQDNDEKRYDYYYVLDMIYTDSSTKSSDNYSYDEYNDNDSSKGGFGQQVARSAASSVGSTLGEGVGHVLIDAAKLGHEWGEDTGRFDFYLGYFGGFRGKCGEISGRFQYREPMGIFGFGAGGGYNLKHNVSVGNDKKFNWNAGIQLWFNNWNFIELGVGQFYFHAHEQTALGMYMQTSYTQPLTDRIGVFVTFGTAVNTARKEADDWLAYYSAGIVIRLRGGWK
ncbi:MAG: hypothetical protein IJS19_02275 [Muribaculaceae bacterium]|nr:hypothetical protein [Muribaculaceae bacterium]